MKHRKLFLVILAVALLLCACAPKEYVDDFEMPSRPTASTEPTQPDPTDPTEPAPTEPQPTEPEPTEPEEEPTEPEEEPTEPSEPEVEFDPNEQEHVHRFGTWKVSKKATCTKEGTKVRSCGCGEMETKSYLLEHNYGDWTPKEPATCTETGIDARYCTMCDKEETTVAAVLGHDEVVTPGTPATCTTPGVKDLIQCARCNLVLQEATVIESGHQIVEQKYVAPTCGLPGQTEGSYCARCLEVFEKSEVIAAKSHTYITVPGRAATCTEFGLTDSVVCSDCGAVMTGSRIIDRLGHTLENGACVRCGHTCDHGVDPGKPGYPSSSENKKGGYEGSSCVDRSYSVYECTSCGQESKLYLSLIHNFPCEHTEYRVVIDPTPERTGLMERHCKSCKRVELQIMDGIVHVDDARFEFYSIGGAKFQHGEGYWDYFTISDERPAGSSTIRYQILSDTELKVMWVDEEGKECYVVLQPSTDSERPCTKCVVSTDGKAYVSNLGWVTVG